MGIERMTLVEFSGNSDCLDDVLERALHSGLFQPENAARLSEYSVGDCSLHRNPYGTLSIKINEIASQLKINLELRAFDRLLIGKESRQAFIEQAGEYLNRLRDEFPPYFEKKHALEDELASYHAAIDMLKRINRPDIDFDSLFSGTFIKVRFGKMPSVGYQSMDKRTDKPFSLYELSTDGGYTWCIYITAEQFHDDIDELFAKSGFQRLRIPDYVHGTTPNAIAYVEQGIHTEMASLKATEKEIDHFIAREEESFLMVYSKNKFLYSAYDLRKYVVEIRNIFHVVGFVLTKEKENFLGMFDDLKIHIIEKPAEKDTRLHTPVKLRNNWFTKPFEMFVNMYGSPSYEDIDPTSFVAYTYCLLFGIMFGDVGQGLLISLVGMFVTRWKKMPLGGIMTRIGISSAVFGLCYGSVFGFEDLLNPMFYALGFHEKPIEVLHPDTTSKILLTSIGLGVSLIIMVIIFNMCMGIKHKDYSRFFFSQNGLVGLMFYGGALVAVVTGLQGINLLNSVYITVFFVLPILVMFFREPITRLIDIQGHKNLLHKDKYLMDSAVFKTLDTDITKLFTTEFITARFGRIPIDSYQKLTFYMEEPFMMYTLKSDTDYIWIIYAMATPEKEQIDAIFHDLYFERIYIPQDDLASVAQAEAFMKSCIEAGGNTGNPRENPSKKPGLLHTLFPEGVANFIIESFFEMFEVLLSFITNTMSFLRVGGFILSHAGMMSVVMTLSGMVSVGASPVVVIIGNLFVIGLEGLIVGIQCLRLEFYEMFSRFFDGEGEPFIPVTVTERGSASL